MIIGGVIVDPNGVPDAERPPTLGWIEPDQVGEIIDALLAAIETPGVPA